MATGKYEGLNGSDYWIKRSQEIQDEKYKDIKKVEKSLAKEYRKALDDVQASLSLFYTKYAEENSVSYSEAMKHMDAYDISNYGVRMNLLKRQAALTKNPFVIAEMEKLFQVGRVARFNALMAEIDAQLILLGHKQQIEMEEWLGETYESVYYQTAFIIQTGTGVGFAMAQINPTAVHEALTFPWSGDQFSERIWSNRTKLVNEMRQIITQSIIQGLSVQKAARQLKEKMDSSYKNALRLVNTETAHVITSATAKGYEKANISLYIYVGTLDNKTSKICQSLDNKVFNLKDKQVGVNCPPMHPNCRSAIAPYFSDEEQGERRSKVDGESVIVENMNYEEWAKRYLK